MYVVTIPGKPKAMDRPRVALHGFKSTAAKERSTYNWRPDAPPRPVGVHVYVPRGTLAYEELVAAEAMAAGVKRIAGAVGVEAEFYVFAPNPRSGGDSDNLLKTILDGLKGVAYEDDSAVDYLAARKVYVQSRADQKAVVRIGRLEEFQGKTLQPQPSLSGLRPVPPAGPTSSAATPR